jgi:four helix bundle protein
VDKNSTIAFNFEQLDVYQLAVDLVNDIYILTKRFQREEMFGLTSQLRRSAVSIAANIAEGSARTSKEFAHFVNIAKGSVLECVTLLEIAFKQQYIDEKERLEAKAKLVRLSEMLSGLRRAVNHKPILSVPNAESRILNPQPQTTNHKPQTGFTLIELMVAIGLMAMVIGFSGVIFRLSVDSQRTAAANAEIMQKLRVITEQLDADFKGLLRSCGGHNGTYTDTINIAGKQAFVNSDTIVFFTNGDFQSTQQYGGRTVVGNVVCIYFGQPDPNSFTGTLKPQDKMLLRRQTILTASDPAAASSPRGEYYIKSLSEWKVGPPFPSGADWAKRPLIDPNNLKGYLPMYMTRGVDNFTIYYAEKWDISKGTANWQRSIRGPSSTINPIAFKFEFTLYDSKGIIKNGRTFTHIVLVPQDS